MKQYIQNSWDRVLKEYTETDSFKKLSYFVEKEYQEKTIYPKHENIFSALNNTSFENISVVIIGQDPYHQPDQAHGLSFSVLNGKQLPPSLRNIYKEIESDIGVKKDYHNGNLTDWSHQGILLLNSILTVEENNPGSHTNHGWEEFTDYIIKKISNEHEHIVFLLWGNYAKKKGSIIDTTKHLVLESSHPSPLGAYRGFLGCKHFSKANNYLLKNGKKKIQW